MAEEVDEYLAHFGVKGMRWGKRKPESQDRINDGNHTSPKNPKNVAKAKPEKGGGDSAPKKSRVEKRADKIEARTTKLENDAKDRLEKAGGSKVKANAAIAGRTVALNMLAGAAATIAMSALSNKPAAKALVGAGANAFGIINTAVGVRDMIGVASQPSERK